MARIFLTGSGPHKGYHTGSGILSLPPRVIIRQQDSNLGTYPTSARVGDVDFSGRFGAVYDDTETLNFVTSSVLYPVNLLSRNRHISGNVATPNQLQGLITKGAIRPGTSDNNISFVQQLENVSPFNESRQYLDNDTVFYQTGTSESTVLTFAQRLSSKVAIEIDAMPQAPTDFFFSTGTTPNASGLSQGVNTGYGYFNWNLRRWEIVGDLSTGSNIDILNSDSTVRRKGLLAFAPSNFANFAGELFTDSGVEPISLAHGLPFTNYGFPFASKYDATGSQCLSMKDYISCPFLLEKVVVEFSASFGPHNTHVQFHGPNIKQFFLLRQSNASGSLQNFEDTLLLCTNPGTTTKANVQHGLRKDIIAYGQISVMGGPSTPSSYKRDLNIQTTDAFGSPDNTQRLPTTGTFRLPFSPKVVSKNNFAGACAFTVGNTREAPFPDRESSQISIGGRTAYDISDGRSFVKPVGALSPVGLYRSATQWNAPDLLNTPMAFTISSAASLERASPYILLPNDKIVFGFSNTPNFYVYTQFGNANSKRYEEGLRQANVVLSPGVGKITLYGSLLRDNQHIPSEQNQPLTSNALHEDIHYDDPVYDQFDVEPTSAFAGSYLDNIVTGTIMSVSRGGGPWQPNVRSVVANVSLGQAGVTGSLQRFVRLSAETQKFVFDRDVINGEMLYDSVIKNFTGSTGKGILPDRGTYGLADGRLKMNSAIFRWDRYGQFRDLLEQCPGIAFTTIRDGRRSNEFPVDVKFFSRASRNGTGVFVADPTQTHSQNLSSHATSSMPYYDNDKPAKNSTASNGVDRPDNPDVTLADTTITI